MAMMKQQEANGRAIRKSSRQWARHSYHTPIPRTHTLSKTDQRAMGAPFLSCRRRWRPPFFRHRGPALPPISLILPDQQPISPYHHLCLLTRHFLPQRHGLLTTHFHGLAEPVGSTSGHRRVSKLRDSLAVMARSVFWASKSVEACRSRELASW